MDSLFFQLGEIQRADSTMTGLQREMLRMSLEANPGVTLGAAVQDVFDYLGVKIKTKRLEAICRRLITENEQRQTEAGPEEGKAPKGRNQSQFGQELIKWIEGLHASERLLTALSFNAPLAQQIYCEQDYLVTDTICTLFLQDRWNNSLIQLQAAAAPWMGNGKSGPKGEVEYHDMTQLAEDDPLWNELGSLFGPA